jgi:hypothetical protein
MKRIYAVLVVALLSPSVLVAGPRPAKSDHVLMGPYEYDESGKRFPVYFLLDGHRVRSIDELKFAVSELQPGSKVFLDGSCISYDFIELPPRPYMSLAAFRRFCRSHQITFDWYFGR